MAKKKKVTKKARKTTGKITLKAVAKSVKKRQNGAKVNRKSNSSTASLIGMDRSKSTLEEVRKWNPSFKTQFQPGNKLWQNRSKHGRSKIFATPEIMREEAYRYFEWCDNNPWMRIDYKGKDVERVEIPTQRPYTMQALAIFLDCSSEYFSSFKSTCKDPEFLGVIREIEDIVYSQKAEGGLVKAYDSNLTSRILGLKEGATNDVINSSEEPMKVQIVGGDDKVNKLLGDVLQRNKDKKV